MNTLFLQGRARLILFAVCGAFVAFAVSLQDTTFSNYIDVTYHISDVMRGWTELPREFPGFFMVLLAFSLFYAFGDIRLAVIANFIAAIGIIGMGFYSHNYLVFLGFTFLMQTGVHVYMPLTSSIAVTLSGGKNPGTLLGQLQGVSTMASFCAFIFIFFGFRYFHVSYQLTYLLAAISFAIAGLLFILMLNKQIPKTKSRLLLRKRYALFYWLNILYGARKQVFLTFAPWVLIKVYHQHIEVFAILGIVGAAVGMFFKPFLGRMIDKLGERFILAAEAVVLVIICVGYAFAQRLFSNQIALVLVFACYIIDQMLMGVSMARVTYLKKIALEPEDISPTVAMGISIDHIVSMTIPIGAGLLWYSLGYEAVFIAAALIAVVNFFSALKIRDIHQNVVG
ncbi:MAG: MFS transporter [Hyphomonadaceae bacterium]|nr:MFS transporter [Clostridia bacterium]